MQNTPQQFKKVAFHTLGCRLNFSETGSLAQGFNQRGYQIVPFGESADVVFLNTCTVTDGADSTCRQLIRKAHRSSPEATIVVAGCYAQMEAEKVSQMQGVDLVLGTSEKYKVFDYLENEQQQHIAIDKTSEFWGAATTPEEGHTRAFLKIQDGCNYICSFCIIPQARGRSRVITIEKALQQAESLVSQGFKEIVLTGVNIGEFESTGGEKLSLLLQQLAQITGLQRIRLSSVEPNTLTDELIDVLVSSPKFMHHFHIPLQSGDDEILRKMRRKYDVAFYRQLITKVKSRFPHAGIGADVIVGYPGESEEQFQKTYQLLAELPITHFHVFPYSKRQGTTAVKEENHLQGALKKERVKILRELGERKLQVFTDEQLKREQSVLFETCEEGLWQGYTSNYIKVRYPSVENLKNSIKKLRLSKGS